IAPPAGLLRACNTNPLVRMGVWHTSRTHEAAANAVSEAVLKSYPHASAQAEQKGPDVRPAATRNFYKGESMSTLKQRALLAVSAVALGLACATSASAQDGRSTQGYLVDQRNGIVKDPF